MLWYVMLDYREASEPIQLPPIISSPFSSSPSYNAILDATH